MTGIVISKSLAKDIRAALIKARIVTSKDAQDTRAEFFRVAGELSDAIKNSTKKMEAKAGDGS